eukprot:6440503-Prorocentrum_lima.AAC.1
MMIVSSPPRPPTATLSGGPRQASPRRNPHRQHMFGQASALVASTTAGPQTWLKGGRRVASLVMTHLSRAQMASW